MPGDCYGIGESSEGLESAKWRHRRRRLAAVCLAAGAVSLPVGASFSISAARAGTDGWIGGTSDWNTPTNWNPNNVPVAGDAILINTNDATLDTISYDFPGPTVTLGGITIANSGGGVDVLSMQTAGLVLAAGSESIGNGGGAVVMQSAGQNSASGLHLYGGGSYTLSLAGTLTVGGSEITDFGGGFEQDGGLHTIHTSMLLGDAGGSNGNYLLTGGSLGVGFAEYVGYLGTGTFVQSGGCAQANGLELGYLSAGTGAYTLGPAGTLTIATSAQIGNNGTGSFTQIGGSASVGTSVYLGVNSGGYGSYSLSGGLLTSGVQYVGYAGTGQFTQNGGENSLGSGASLYVGYLSGSTGAYTLCNSGTLAITSSEYIGYGSGGAAYGSFNQNGGSNTLAGSLGNLVVASNAGSDGSYALGGGCLTLAGISTGEQIGAFGTGSFTQTAGVNTVDGTGEIIGAFTGGVGTYSQSGGVNQMVNSYSNLSIGYSAGATGIYNLSGGTLSAANVYIGGSPTSSGGTGTLTISGTGQLTTPGALVIYNTFSAVQVNNGSVAAATANLNGAYTQTGGAAAFGQIIATGPVTISGGQTTLNANGPMSRISSLILNGGTLDITNNTLAITYAPAADPIATILSYISSAYNGGSWSGVGLTSSLAEANPRLTGLGYMDSSDQGAAPNEVLVKYTLIGDTNLDGIVDFDDLAQVLKNYQQTGVDWAGGNFSYDPNQPVGFLDLAAVLANFGKTIASVTIPTVGAHGFAAQVQVTSASLPEPSSAALVVIAAGLLGRRRRKTV